MQRTWSAFLCGIVFLAGCQSKASNDEVITAPGSGVLIGGNVSNLSGTHRGPTLSEQDRQKLKKQSPQTLRRVDRQDKLSLQDIIAMKNAGLSEEVIICQIHSTGSAFYLGPDEISDLKAAGASKHLIKVMKATAD